SRSLLRSYIMPTPIGIDLGTTFSVVAYLEDQKIKVIENEAGKRITPSVVHLGAGTPIVGVEAVRKRYSHPRQTISEIKRFIGREGNDITLRERSWPFEVVGNNRGKASVRVDRIIYSPEEISALILKHMKALAGKYIENPKDAVITVPSNFTNVQRQATKDAGEMAGLNVLQIINEPTAAALAFCYKFHSKQKRKILVYDLGGGTFDVSIVESNGVQTAVLSTFGDQNLGGSDFDLRIKEEIVARFRVKGFDVPNDDLILKDACEKAKKDLARMNSAKIEYRMRNGQVIDLDLTNDTFLEVCEDLFKKTMEHVSKAIHEAGLSKKEIDEVVMVGGSTRIQHVRVMMSKQFPGKKIRTDIDPEIAIAEGAAIMAASLMDGSERKFTETQSPRKPKPNGPVAIQLVDVTPHSLGLRLEADETEIMIPKNTSIPFETHQILTNAGHFDKHLAIEIVEGENDIASQNVELAKFKIEVSPKRKNENSIQVRFKIDKNGILEVTAVDMETKKKASITVQSGNLGEEERRKLTRQLDKMTMNE
ncbi:hypothetical protein PENTCL1PPCAC_5881, partial [Pristionchus entomophagus]